MLKFFVRHTDKGMQVEFVDEIHAQAKCYELTEGDILIPYQMFSVFCEVQIEESYQEWVTDWGDLDYHYDTKDILWCYFRLIVEEQLTYIEVFDPDLQLVYQVEITQNMVGFVLEYDSWKELDQVLIQRFVAGARRIYVYSDQSQIQDDQWLGKLLDNYRALDVTAFAALLWQYAYQSHWADEDLLEDLRNLFSLLVSPIKRYDIQFTEPQQRLYDSLEIPRNAHTKYQLFKQLVDCFIEDESRREEILMDMEYYPHDPADDMGNDYEDQY